VLSGRTADEILAEGLTAGPAEPIDRQAGVSLTVWRRPVPPA
jgi:hypothetical protein